MLRRGAGVEGTPVLLHLPVSEINAASRSYDTRRTRTAAVHHVPGTLYNNDAYEYVGTKICRLDYLYCTGIRLIDTRYVSTAG